MQPNNPLLPAGWPGPGEGPVAIVVEKNICWNEVPEVFTCAARHHEIEVAVVVVVGPCACTSADDGEATDCVSEDALIIAVDVKGGSALGK